MMAPGGQWRRTTVLAALRSISYVAWWDGDMALLERQLMQRHLEN